VWGFVGGCQVASLVKPVATVKRLGVTLRIQGDVPEFAVGDERRLLQCALNVVGNSVKFTSEGSISIVVCLERPDFQRDKAHPKFEPRPAGLGTSTSTSGCR